MSADFNAFGSIIGTAVKAGVMARPVEAWITGVDGGLWGAFCGDNGAWETVKCSSPVQFPVQVFLFDRSGNVSQYKLRAAECGDKAYECA